jgi:hypothetical protein
MEKAQQIANAVIGFYETDRNKPLIYWMMNGLWTLLLISAMVTLSITATGGPAVGFYLTLLFALPTISLATLCLLSCSHNAHDVMKKDPDAYRTTAADWAEPRDLAKSRLDADDPDRVEHI